MHNRSAFTNALFIDLFDLYGMLWARLCEHIYDNKYAQTKSMPQKQSVALTRALGPLPILHSDDEVLNIEGIMEATSFLTCGVKHFSCLFLLLEQLHESILQHSWQEPTHWSYGLMWPQWNRHAPIRIWKARHVPLSGTPRKLDAHDISTSKTWRRTM